MTTVSLQSMRRNIWRALLCATDQEIRDGLDFYPGAHGLCRLFALSHPPLTTSHVAGIYAALSPMNTWDSNVANVLDVLRHTHKFGNDGERRLPSVNTTNINRDKALRISTGADPLSVLGGRKVRAFYLAIADPDNTLPIAIDRHLINLAIGIHNPTKREQADLAHDNDLYSRVERAYTDLGRREGLGNRLASIAWFVQRRIERTGQRPMLHPEAPVCCGSPMWSHGNRQTPLGPKRTFYCPSCRSTQHQEPGRRLVRTRNGWELRERATEGLRVWQDGKGRQNVTLPQDHPYGNGQGYQRLARFIVSESLGRPLRPDEHIHHLDGDLTNDRPENLAVVSVEYHGQIHASAAFVARCEKGRFRVIENSQDERIYPWPRDRAVLGNQARE